MRSHEPMRARRADDQQGLRRKTGASDAPSDTSPLSYRPIAGSFERTPSSIRREPDIVLGERPARRYSRCVADRRVGSNNPNWRLPWTQRW
jgi:hypothetical protein